MHSTRMIRQEGLRTAGKVYGFTVMSAVMCLFLYLSLSMIVRQVATQAVGNVITAEMDNDTTRQVVRVPGVDKAGGELLRETVTELREDGGDRLISDVWYNAASAEAADKERQTLEAAGVKRPQVAAPTQEQTVRTPLSAGAGRALDGVSQCLLLLLYLCFPYSVLWHLGDSDANHVQFGRRRYDRLRGARIGVLAMIPAWGGYLLLVAAKLTGRYGVEVMRLHRMVNGCWMPLTQWLFPAGVQQAGQASWLGILDFAWTLPVLPAVAGVAYWLGFKGISLREKLVYSATGKTLKPRGARRKSS